MQFPERRKDQTEERILPLINVVFLLLIFFMLAGTMTQTEALDVQPPESISQSEPDSELMTLLVSNQGLLALNNELIESELLYLTLKEKIATKTDVQINLKADGQLPANELVRITQRLNDIGLEKLTLITEQANP